MSRTYTFSYSYALASVFWYHRGMSKIVIYTDGGSRGNPGPAAIGVIIGDKEYAEEIGSATNNIAEYKAVIFAFKKVKALVGKEKATKTELEIRSDSELMVSQLSGRYKIKDAEIAKLFLEVWNIKQDFKFVSFCYIPRELNRKADRLVNRALDSKLI